MKALITTLFVLSTFAASAASIEDAQCYIKKSGMKCQSDLSYSSYGAFCKQQFFILTKEGKKEKVVVEGAFGGEANDFANFMTLGLVGLAQKTEATLNAKNNLKEKLEFIEKCSKDDLKFENRSSL